MKVGRFTASDGVELYWRSWTPEGPHRAIVLLLHGVGEHGDRYAGLASELTDAGYTCYAFDHRGHGQSTGPRGHVDRWKRYELDVVEFIGGVIAESDKRASALVVYGHSMGSLILLTLALTDSLQRLPGFLGLVISGASLRPTGLAKPALVAIARLLSGIAPRVSLDLGIPAAALSHEAQVVARYAGDPLVGRRATVRWGTEALAAIESIKQGASQIDTPMLMSLKFGVPEDLTKYTIDSWHTMYYAAGYLFKQAQPRMAAICHFEWSGDQLAAESIAQIRSNWDGLFMFGMDLQVINVTKDAIWAREAVIGDGSSPASMDPRWMVEPGEKLPEKIEFPTPRLPREEQQEQFVRDLEIDPKLYYPTGAYREPVTKWPGVTLNPREMLKAKGIEVDDK